MIFIQKTTEGLSEFTALVFDCGGLYDHLQGEARKKVLELFSLEQRGVCPFCERLLKKCGTNLEHFLPRSRFPGKQLDYYNLFASCITCNGHKGPFLLPAYIFDPHYDCFLQTDASPQTEVRFFYADELVRLKHSRASLAHKTSRPEPSLYSAYLTQNAIDLLDLNDTAPGKRTPSLSVQRAADWAVWESQFKRMSQQGLQRFWADFSTNSLGDFAFPSMIVQLLFSECRKRRIPLP